ncbi:class A beta-lactamase-related serine hydrolase [Laspinema olomoucense]|uniref:Class A beta-lactamase-related serine hydrolase n=1 Tax=Laspinema olomoucense D3b TaxID=2953688 RepID=A0ABT2NHK7_9CYAN|nr:MULTISPECIES: class A beta-lactamase-related serine hydrolase [unclassified Laspinema]MCT7972587.1 class A beta-lactamase-related serine hydrolase [Laspinema sp. D3d]MCT7981225.1 class A beta-lactamase-related serine hydrolase [Laspinema sp. D3b]
MGHPSGSKFPKHHQQIHQLENELDRASQIIEELRRENIHLKHQNAQLQNRAINQQTVLQSDPAVSSVVIPHQNRHKNDSIYEEPDDQTGWEQLSNLPFTVKVLIVVLVIVLAGLATMQLRNLRSVVYLSPDGPGPLSSSELPEPLSISPSTSSTNTSSSSVSSLPPSKRLQNVKLVYNINKNPRFQISDELQLIVDEAIDLAESKGLPTSALSISLIDDKTGKVAGYQEQTLRYPASLAKLFWMVALYAQVEKKLLPEDTVFSTEQCQNNLCKMVQKSDNDAASRIVDLLTDTTSQFQNSENYEQWLNQRQWVNRFFQEAGYQNINISQKNFPIPYLKLDEPQGFELRMRGNPENPLRNKMSSEQVARLMYEIVNRQAVSQKASENMMQLLRRDLRPEVWQQEQYNSVQGFLSELLPISEVYVASKVGWTSTSRQEVAYIATQDGKSAYILAIFGDDPAFANDWKIFPEISLHIYRRMNE